MYLGCFLGFWAFHLVYVVAMTLARGAGRGGARCARGVSPACSQRQTLGEARECSLLVLLH